MKKTAFAAISAALVLPFGLQAATVVPTSYIYDVAPNHSTAYKDDTYNGTIGQLADGVSATGDWQATDGSGLPGPNVGWQNVNPQITFFFEQAYNFGSLTLNAQDGQGTFGVILPKSVTVNAVTSAEFISGGVRTAVDRTMSLASLAATDTLFVTVNRDTSNTWTFLSEFTFETASAAVPLPAGLPLLLAGLGGLVLVQRRRR